MRLGVHIINFEVPGGPGEIGPTLANAGRAVEEAGIDNLSVMDHYFQMEMAGGPSSPCWRATPRSASSRRTRPPSSCSCSSPGSPTATPGCSPRSSRPSTCCPAGARCSVSAPRGTTASTSASGCRSRRSRSASSGWRRRCRSSTRCGATTTDRTSARTTARRDDQRRRRPSTQPHPPIMIGGIGGEEDAAAGGAVRRRVQPLHRPGHRCRRGPGEARVLDGHCANEGTDVRRIRKTILWTGPLDPDAAAGLRLRRADARVRGRRRRRGPCHAVHRRPGALHPGPRGSRGGRALRAVTRAPRLRV